MEPTHYLKKPYINELIHSHIHAMAEQPDWVDTVEFSPDCIDHLTVFVLFVLGPNIRNMELGAMAPTVDGRPVVGSLVAINIYETDGSLHTEVPPMPWPMPLLSLADKLYHFLDKKDLWMDVPYSPGLLNTNSAIEGTLAERTAVDGLTVRPSVRDTIRAYSLRDRDKPNQLQ